MKNFAIQGICDKFAVQPAKARVAELVDALDSKSCVLNRRAGSSPASGTREISQQIDCLLADFNNSCFETCRPYIN